VQPPITACTEAQGNSSALINEVHNSRGDNEGISDVSVDKLMKEEAKDIATYADGIRCAHRVDDNQDQLLAYAWVLPKEHRKGPILPREKIPPTIFMDKNHPVVKTYYLPLTERCINYTPIHCQQALERYGNKFCPGNLGLSQEAYDYSNSDDGNDVFQYPSPQKKQKTAKEQAYEVLKPEVDEMFTILGDSFANSQVLSYCKGKLTELVMELRAELSAHLPKPQGQIVSSAAPTSKRLKTHGTQHYSKHKHK
jgi:hypothetical protein